MSASKKIQSAIKQASWIRKMFEEGASRKAIYGEKNVFDFSIGNPNIEPPAEFKAILNKLINNSSRGAHSYMSNAGYEDTREAVARYLTKNSSKSFSRDDIVMTVGSGGALNIILKTILDPDDEVVILTPCFMEYKFYVDNHQGIPVFVASNPDFSLDLDKIKAAITQKTRAVMINSPNNPTGKIFSRDELESLAGLLTEYSNKNGAPIYLISDEPYKKIAFDGNIVPSIFDVYKNTFLGTSFSKDLSLPGERIGYAAVNPDMEGRGLASSGLVLSNRILGYVNAPALMQRAVNSLLDVSIDVRIYEKKRDILCDGLASMGYEFFRPQGAFYLFPKSPIPDDIEFVSILKDENILTVPGIGFGGPGFFRIAFCVSDETIINSLPGFERAIKKFK
ncbi:MAG: pyridoxal phosphate-dependent aminotransferase [Deltaproteobacteria bacterium]|nr:pyridoxal phosphate-dependent aminotransferase [Deltaproteobacteria bacterium]